MFYTVTTWMVSYFLITSLTVHNVKSDSHVIVRPTVSDPSICGDHVLCDTLSNLISKNQTIFRDKTYSTFDFLEGKHEINLKDISQLIVTNGSKKLTCRGSKERKAVISCKSQLVFVFIKITLTLINLEFSECGYRLPLNFISQYNSKVNKMSAAIALLSLTSFDMQNVAITQSRGYGLLGVNLRGSNDIFSCHFFKNRAETECSAGECAGGNVALYFYNKSKRKLKVSLSITDSIFQDGADWSNKNYTFSCSELHDKSFSHPVFRANGLAIIAGQNTYRVTLKVTNTNFSKNTGNSLHPAVWVHDYGGVADNRFEFINCSFEREGTVRISSLENQACVNEACVNKKTKKNSMCYICDSKNPSIPIPYFTLSMCSFTNSSHTALEICVKPTYIFRNKSQLISIARCTFQNYEPGSKSKFSVISIDYITRKENPRYPSIAIEIAQSHFTHNKIPALDCHLGQDNYASISKKNEYEYLRIVSLTDNYFAHNLISNSALVVIRSQSEYLIPIWKYETSRNEDGDLISRACISRCTFMNNTAQQGSLRIENVYIILNNSTFESSQGTALYALRSVVHIEGVNLLNRNNGTFGGALNLNMSRIFVTSNSHMTITNNTALYGGGMFALTSWTAESFETESDETYGQCTISYEEDNNTVGTIKFIENKAIDAGHSIFGQTCSNCHFVCTRTNTCSATSPRVIQILEKDSLDSEITPPPTKLCICKNQQQRNKFNEIRLAAFPGQTFTVPLIAMEGLNQASRAVVAGTMCKTHQEESNGCRNDYRNDIGYGQRMQELDENCTDVIYTVNTQSNTSIIEIRINYHEIPNKMNEEIKLLGKNISKDNADTKVIVKIDLLPCPTGFQLEISNKYGQPSSCRCLEYFNRQSIHCNNNNGTVVKPPQKWIFSGIGIAMPAIVNRTAVHNSCPFDYCIAEEKSVNLSEPDKQCRLKRSGVLCGACQMNLSIVLGSSNCKKCSNVYLLLIIPFALAGVALVVLLLKCNLTVSVGHINGIMFYANIVQVNKALLFPNNQSIAYHIFSTFIAWLNLDLGIETCFFENMDSYAKVWLQFVFPVYVWIIIALIIFLANYSRKLGTLIGNNAVPVLATLFLLSYAKLLRTIIAAVAFTFIEFEDDSYITVWLRDGNVKYFDPKHIVLFLVALLFTLLYILPLTLLVLLAPCLQARSHHKAFRWVNRLKPFLDAYQGPYSDKFRFWTGLLLILRIVLFIIDASNYGNDPSMSFFCTIGVIIPLAMVLVRFGVYRHTLANCIELLSLLNLMILFAVSWLTTRTEYPKWHPIREYATYISVAVMMLMFIGIILYQLLAAIHPKLIMVVYPKVFDRRDKSTEQTTGETAHAVSVEPPTSTTVELQECVQLKEPLLETN